MLETQIRSREAAAVLDDNPASNRQSSSWDGHLVKLVGNQLLRMGSSGEQFLHQMDGNTRVTCDGIRCRPSDLLVGQRIRVTNALADPRLAGWVEVLNTHDHFVAES